VRTITTNGSTEFNAVMAECRRNGWRITSLSRGTGNAGFVFSIDTGPEQPDLLQVVYNKKVEGSFFCRPPPGGFQSPA
jgi:hypothetical protein